MLSVSNKRGVKQGKRKLKMIQRLLLVTCLGSLMGCQIAPPLPLNPPICVPTAPQIHWIKTIDGGMLIPKQGVSELVNYIQDLRECALSQ